MANISRSTKKKKPLVVKKSTMKKNASKVSVRPVVVKKSSKKKVAPKKVVKKNPTQIVKRSILKKKSVTAVKKTSKPTKSAVKKTGLKKAKVDDRKVLVCSACNSSHLRSEMVGNHILYTCLSCAFKSQSARLVPVSEVKSSLIAQKRALRMEYGKKRIPHVKSMRRHLHRFPVRVMFGLTGMILFVIGVILLTSPEKVTAGFLLVFGAIIAYLGEKV
jgi:hypothetical protein